MAEQPPLVKSYSIVNPSIWTTRNLECQHNGQTFLWISMRARCFSSTPSFTIHTGSPKGPIIAAAKYPSIGHGIRVALGDPGASQIQWSELDRSFSEREIRFMGPDDRPYVWRRTRNRAIGASPWSGMDYKLLSVAADERILGVFARKMNILASGAEGRIDWMVELEPNVELFAMTAILMLNAVQRVRNGST